MHTSKISIIIPAHQEESQIADTLEALTTQTYKNFEVVVVVNGCTDNTVPIAKTYSEKLPLSIIDTKERGIGYACNLGAKNSSGEIVLILEADTIIPNNGVEKIAQAIHDGNIGGTIKMNTKEDRFIYMLGCKFLEYIDGAGWGPIRFATREAYEKIGGHRENGDYGVDDDFAHKIKALGSTAYIKDISYKTSMRRFEKSKKEMFRQTMHYIMGKFGKEAKSLDYDVVR